MGKNQKQSSLILVALFSLGNYMHAGVNPKEKHILLEVEDISNEIMMACPVSDTFSNGNDGGTHNFSYTDVESLMVDFDFINNAFQMTVNSQQIHPNTLETETAEMNGGDVLLVFQSNNLEMQEPWLSNSNGLPRLRLNIDQSGNITLQGSRTTTSTVMETMIVNSAVAFNTITFPSGTTSITIVNPNESGNDGISGTITVQETCSTPDTQNPTAPTLSSTGKTDTTANLSWGGATDNTGVTGYKVYKGGALEATLGNVSTYQVTGLTASTTYSFTVAALDAAGNESTASNSVSVTTDATSGGGSSVWTESGSVASYSGDVAIGGVLVPTGYKLAVDGKLIVEEIKVQPSGNWPDYVFAKDYDLPTLEEIKKHIEEKGHLPNIPSEEEVQANGVELGEMNRLLLEKVEELTLYILQQEKRITELENQDK